MYGRFSYGRMPYGFFWLKAAAGGFTAKFRKTLSQIGGRVGSRQLQGWG